MALLARIILASTKQGAWILDPFAGSSTTGIAANLLNRKYLGIDSEEEYLNLSKMRREELESPEIYEKYLSKIRGFKSNRQLSLYLSKEPKTNSQYDALPF